MNKNLISIIWILGILGSPMSHAGKPSEQLDTLSAQVNVTRDAIQQLISKLQSTRLDDGYSHPDFLAKSKEFNEKVEKAMIQFETILTNDVLKPASVWADRIKSIQASKIYSEIQKTNLVKDQTVQAREFFDSLSQKYQDAIWDLYLIALPPIFIQYDGYAAETERCHWLISECLTSLSAIYRITSEDPLVKLKNQKIALYLGYDSFPDNPNGEKELTDDLLARMKKNFDKGQQSAYLFSIYYKDYRNSSSTFSVTSGVLESALQEAIFSGRVERNCYSSSCISLYASQVLAYLDLVKTSLDKPITFSGVNELVIQPKYFSVYNVTQLFETPANHPIHLPFDISDADYRRALMDQMIKNLTDPQQIFDQGCTAEVAKLKSLACHSEGAGCFSTAEKDQIEGKILAADLSKDSQARRIGCLRSQ